MAYLHIEYMDGAKERRYYSGDIGVIQVRDEALTLVGGDGSYPQRGKQEGWPLKNIRKWWTSQYEDGDM